MVGPPPSPASCVRAWVWAFRCFSDSQCYRSSQHRNIANRISTLGRSTYVDPSRDRQLQRSSLFECVRGAPTHAQWPWMNTEWRRSHAIARSSLGAAETSVFPCLPPAARQVSPCVHASLSCTPLPSVSGVCGESICHVSARLGCRFAHLPFRLGTRVSCWSMGASADRCRTSGAGY